MEQQWCGKHQLTIHSRKVQHLDQSSYETMSIRGHQQPHVFFKVWDCKVYENKGCIKGPSIVEAHESLMSPIFCIVFSSVL